MGPYSEERQQRRRELLAGLLLNTNLSDDMKQVYERHLNNLAHNEEEYTHRVAQIYGGTTWNRYTGTYSPILLDQ